MIVEPFCPPKLLSQKLFELTGGEQLPYRSTIRLVRSMKAKGYQSIMRTHVRVSDAVNFLTANPEWRPYSAK